MLDATIGYSPKIVGNFVEMLTHCKLCEDNRKLMKTLKEKKEEVKVAEVTVENEVHVNLCKGEGFLVKEDFLVNYTDVG